MNETVHTNELRSGCSAHHARAVRKISWKITYSFGCNVTKSVRMSALTEISLRLFSRPSPDLASMSVVSLANFTVKLWTESKHYDAINGGKRKKTTIFGITRNPKKLASPNFINSFVMPLGTLLQSFVAIGRSVALFSAFRICPKYPLLQMLYPQYVCPTAAQIWTVLRCCCTAACRASFSQLPDYSKL